VALTGEQCALVVTNACLSLCPSGSPLAPPSLFGAGQREARKYARSRVNARNLVRPRASCRNPVRIPGPAPNCPAVIS